MCCVVIYCSSVQSHRHILFKGTVEALLNVPAGEGQQSRDTSEHCHHGEAFCMRPAVAVNVAPCGHSRVSMYLRHPLFP